MATRVAAGPEEALRENPAFQVPAKLILDVPREPALVPLARECQEGLEVVADERVEGGFGRSTGDVCGGEAGHEPSASRLPCQEAARVFRALGARHGRPGRTRG